MLVGDVRISPLPFFNSSISSFFPSDSFETRVARSSIIDSVLETLFRLATVPPYITPMMPPAIPFIAQTAPVLVTNPPSLPISDDNVPPFITPMIPPATLSPITRL